MRRSDDERSATTWQSRRWNIEPAGVATNVDCAGPSTVATAVGSGATAAVDGGAASERRTSSISRSVASMRLSQ
jgi:hypothetical protein